MEADLTCLFFGCWNEAGHFMWRPNRQYVWADWTMKFDGGYAPRRYADGRITWSKSPAEASERRPVEYRTGECRQGRFLLHRDVDGYTVMSWWDRCQGDTRGACNSNLLLKGEHTVDEMMTALRAHFPHVLANLQRHGVELVAVESTP